MDDGTTAGCDASQTPLTTAGCSQAEQPEPVLIPTNAEAIPLAPARSQPDGTSPEPPPDINQPLVVTSETGTRSDRFARWLKSKWRRKISSTWLPSCTKHLSCLLASRAAGEAAFAGIRRAAYPCRGTRRRGMGPRREETRGCLA